MWCDLIRRPFRTRARLLRDSDQEFDIRWYFAAEGAQQLPWPSPIHVLHRNDQEWIKTSVGDLLFADTTLEKPNVVNPLPAGDHYHGTEEDFREGGLYLPDLPPFPRDEDGIPTVCRPPVHGLVLGGVGITTPPARLVLAGGTQFTFAGTGFGGTALDRFSYWCKPNANSLFSAMNLVSATGGSNFRIRAWSGIENRKLVFYQLDGFGSPISTTDLGYAATYDATIPRVTLAVFFLATMQTDLPGSFDPWQLYWDWV